MHSFVSQRTAELSAELDVLVAESPALALHDLQSLQARAAALGQQLLALERFVQLNEAGFVKIVKKHDKARELVAAVATK